MTTSESRAVRREIRHARDAEEHALEMCAALVFAIIVILCIA